MKRSKIPRVSDKKMQQLIDEVPIRKQLCERSGGEWVSCPMVLAMRDKVVNIEFGWCSGGRCEECGDPPDWRGLHPDEEKSRGQGGKLSLSNSQMKCGRCHSRRHGVKEVT